MCDFPNGEFSRIPLSSWKTLPARPDRVPPVPPRPVPNAATPASGNPPRSIASYRSQNQTPPNAAATTFSLSLPNAAALQSSNARPAKSLLRVQYKSVSQSAATQQRSFQSRSLPAAPHSVAGTDSQSANSPAAAREFASPVPQYRSLCPAALAYAFPNVMAGLQTGSFSSS